MTLGHASMLCGRRIHPATNYQLPKLNIGLPKSKQTKFEDLTVTIHFDFLVKYTDMLRKMINIMISFMYKVIKAHLSGQIDIWILVSHCKLI